MSSILPGCRRHLRTMAFLDRQHAGLGGHDHLVVVGDDVARRAQAVAVERRADLDVPSVKHIAAGPSHGSISAAWYS